jgi:spore germination protein YaaH
MRDKYIEIIKEYIKEKPGYESALDELKACMLAIGATEQEFDEAIRQITELPEPSKQILTGNTAQPMGKAKTPIEFVKHLQVNKKYVIALLFTVIAVGVLLQLKILNFGGKIADSVQNLPVVSQPVAKIPAIPVVYANSDSVDPEKIFSIKSTNVQLMISGKPKKEVLGFFPYWMLPEEDKVNLNALTSISLFGLEMDGAGNVITNSETADGSNMWKDPKLDDFIRRAQNQGLKVYLTLKCFNNSNIESLSRTDASQKKLIANALYLVNSKSLNGVNIDFEYLGTPTDEVRNGFTRLIANLNSELKRQIPQAVLTVDTYLVSGSEKQLFDLPLLANNLDAFVIMGYDMHTPLGAAGPVSAMGGDTNVIGYVQNYLEQVKASKIILAIPYYGYDWPKDATALSRDMVKTLPYAVIAQMSQNLQLSWDDTAQTPYFTYKDGLQTRIVHFDNVRSLGIKYDFINRKNLKGVGIWTLGYDGQNQDLEKLLIDKFINQ